MIFSIIDSPKGPINRLLIESFRPLIFVNTANVNYLLLSVVHLTHPVVHLTHPVVHLTHPVGHLTHPVGHLTHPVAHLTQSAELLQLDLQVNRILFCYDVIPLYLRS